MNAPLQVKQGVARPAGIRSASTGNTTYPFEKMLQRDDFLHVPWYMFFGPDATPETADSERWDSKKHRERVNNAARGYALKKNKEAESEPDYDAQTFKPLRFTVAPTKDEDGLAGIGVWRD